MGMGTGTGTADSLTPQQFFATVTTAGKTITSVTGTMSLKGTFNGSQMSESGPIKATYANGALQAMDLQLSMTVQGQNLKISLRTVGDAAFIGGSSVMTALGAPAAGKTWARLDKNSPDEHLAALGSVLDSALAFGKNGAIPATIETAKKVTKIGPEKIGALATTKYEVAMPPPAAGGSGTTSVTDSGSTTSYWLDDRNRVVKTSSISGRQGIDLDLVYTVDSFDRPLRIDRPSPADVYAP